MNDAIDQRGILLDSQFHSPNLVGPYIPYMGMYLQHIILIDEGNPTKLGPTKLFNYYKCGLVAMRLSKIIESQQQSYHQIFKKSLVIQVIIFNFSFFFKKYLFFKDKNESPANNSR